MFSLLKLILFYKICENHLQSVCIRVKSFTFFKSRLRFTNLNEILVNQIFDLFL